MGKKNQIIYNQILHVAASLIQQKGYDHVTVAEIVKAANVSLGTFYSYFPSKSSLLSGVRKIDTYFEAAVKPLILYEDVEKDINTFFLKYGEYIERDGLETVGGLYQNHQIKLLISLDAPLFQLLVSILQSGQEKGQLSRKMTAEKLSRQLVMSAQGVMLQWIVCCGQFDIKHELCEIASVMIQSYRMEK